MEQLELLLEQVKEGLQNAQLTELLDEWEMALKYDKYDSHIRGLLLDELRSRNPEAFQKWLEQDKYEKTLSEFMTE